MNRSLAVVVALILSLACTVKAQSSTPNLSGLSLAPGDVIRIEVWRDKEMSGDFPIAADGTITHPLYRELKVAGVPLPAVRDMLRIFLSKFESNPTFTVTPLLRVIVAGEVRQPNILTVPAGTTVAQAIAMAGGPTDRGRLDRVKLVRKGSSQTLDVTRPDASAATSELQSGDEVIVARARNIMQDIVAPSSSILAALASITSVVIQVTRRP
ncbi:MAG TPA: SLBB domain-containing protein [Acidobacteriaceae bacterium]|nr:SLBB domain-containing protein [Acidobacteriaceae bacterium]